MVTDDYASRVEAAALHALVWSETDDEGNPLAWQHTAADVKGGDRRAFYGQVRDFLALCEREGVQLEDLDPGQVGHDFTLTRNGHGAGFWDRGLGERGDRLTDLCRPYGTAALFVDSSGFLRLA